MDGRSNFDWIVKISRLPVERSEKDMSPNFSIQKDDLLFLVITLERKEQTPYDSQQLPSFLMQDLFLLSLATY